MLNDNEGGPTVDRETNADRLRAVLEMSEPTESSVVAKICAALNIDPDGPAPAVADDDAR